MVYYKHGLRLRICLSTSTKDRDLKLEGFGCYKHELILWVKGKRTKVDEGRNFTTHRDKAIGHILEHSGGAINKYKKMDKN